MESEPAGARVLVDGRARGVSPLELAELAFGSYDVRVEQRGYEPERRRVELRADAPSAELRLALKQRAAPTVGTADFASNPAGALVSVDGKPPARRRCGASSSSPASGAWRSHSRDTRPGRARSR